WKFEWQADPASAWQPVALQGAPAVQPIASAGYPLNGFQLLAYWQPPAGGHPAAIRGVVSDRAGNSATYQVRMDTAPALPGPLLAPRRVGPATPPRPALPAQPAAIAPSAASPPTSAAPTGATSGFGPLPRGTPTATTPASPPAVQPWPANNLSRAPFRL